MSEFKNKMKNILNILKTEYGAKGIKIEFSSECPTEEEVEILKAFSVELGMEITSKISGCEDLKSIIVAKKYDFDNIVAPMIESCYAAKKFLDNVNMIFQSSRAKCFINIETIDGVKSIKKIVNDDYFKYVDGIVFGRTDMCGSLGLKCCDVNSDIIFEYAKKVAQEAKNNNKLFIIGGGVSSSSVEFFENINHIYLTDFETRKIIFDSKCALKNNHLKNGIKLALDFELMWLNYKKNLNGYLTTLDNDRIDILSKRY